MIQTLFMLAGFSTLQGTGADDCTTPDRVALVAGFKQFYDTTTATTGVEGQQFNQCYWFGTTNIESDVWFVWTAPSTGLTRVEVWPDVSSDSKAAVYEGSGCPSGPPLACNDDGFGVFYTGSVLEFEAYAGRDYTFQIGSYPGATPSYGTLEFYPPAPFSKSYSYDDASCENAWGLSVAGDFAWLQQYDAVGGVDAIKEVGVAFGCNIGVGLPPNGTPATVVVWDDPNEDGLPHDAVVVASERTFVANAGTGQVVAIPIDPPATVSGRFFVGVVMSLQADEYPAAADDSMPGHRAWVVANYGGPLDPNCLGCSSYPPVTLWSQFSDYVFLLRAVGGPGFAYCSGSSVAPCPCGNVGVIGAGCTNSTGRGASLSSSGGASVHADDLILWMQDGPPNKAGLFLMGSSEQTGALGVPFKDGLLCISQGIIRSPAQFLDGNGRMKQENLVAASKGLIVSGATWHFQSWFRDNAPCGHRSNLSNAVKATFIP